MITKTSFKTKNYTKVKFDICVEGATKVQILGLNNDWANPKDLKAKQDGNFSLEINLDKDQEHTFKYFVDGTNWHTDNHADKQVDDGFGGLNSVVIL